MSLLFSTAYAATTTAPVTAQPQANFVGFVLPIILVIAVFYLLVWRPQSKRTRDHRNLLSNLGVGDEIVISAGILGKVVKLEDQYVTVNIATGTDVLLQKQAIAGVLPKGTLRSTK